MPIRAPLKDNNAGADPGFQVKGAHLKIAPNGGRRENFWGISCEKSRFYAKKNHIFANFRGAPPMDPPLQCIYHNTKTENAKKKSSID